MSALAALASAAVGAGTQIWDSAREARQSKYNVNRTIQANKEAADLAYQRNVEMWHTQNAYNSPEQQMARFKAAGLNPHLIYGQGSPGNAQAPPNYQPPDYRYQYQAARISPGVNSILPTLMDIGSWMQDMRLKDAAYDKTLAETQRTSTDTERLGQVVAFLEEKNPRLLQELDNKLGLFPYQKDATRFNAGLAAQKLDEAQQAFRLKYGDDLYRFLPRYSGTAGFNPDTDKTPQGGLARIEFLKKFAESEIAQAKASWTDMNITDPQAIMQMVMQGVLSLAGQHINLKSRTRPRVTETHTVRRVGRTTTTKIDRPQSKY